MIGDVARAKRAQAVAALAVLTTLLLAVAPSVVTADPARLTIQAQIDRNHIAVGEEAQITVVASANRVNLPDYALATVPGLRILRVGNSQDFSWINGNLARSSTSVFLVSASAPGRYTIPAVRIASGGLHAETQPIVLDVSGAGSSTPAPGAPPSGSGEASPPRVWGDESLPEMFVRMVVDHRRVYWNQQITARFVLYSRDRLEEVPMWEVAEANGFWKEPLGEMKRTRVRVGNTDYIAYEQDVAYFPTRTGALTLGPGRIEARVARAVAPAPDPWSLLGFPETRVETIPLQTENASVSVLALPSGAPAAFRGAVGKLSMDVTVDRLVARAGEPVTVTTILRGRGNLNTAGDPDVSATLPLRSFESPGAVTARNTGFQVRGERRHEKAFVPEVPGAFSINPIHFAWFDPEEGRFYTQTSDSIHVRVVAGGDSTLAAAGPMEPPAAPRHKPGPRGSLSLGPSRGAAVVGAGSLVALAGMAVLSGARRRARLDPTRRRRAELDRLARELKELRLAHAPPAAGAARAAAAVGHALGLRYDADVEGRSREETLRRAAEAGADPATLEEARRHLEALERLAFAPALAGAGDDAIAASQAFVERLAREVA